MDQTTPTPNPVPPQASPAPQPLQPQHDKKVGPIVGALIIVLILIVAALIFFMKKLNTEAPLETQAPVVQENTQHQMQASVVSSNDDIATLQAELDAEMKDVDYSF